MKKIFFLVLIALFIGTFNYHIGDTYIIKDLRKSIEVDRANQTMLENLTTPLLARLLVKLIDVNALNEKFHSLPLIAQIQHYNRAAEGSLQKGEHYKIIKIYLNEGADVNKALPNGDTALFYVQDMKIFNLLYEHKVDINHINKRGETAYFTIKNPLVKYDLLEKRIATKSINKDRDTLLHHSIADFNIKFLLNQGLDVAARNDQGNTPLMSLLQSPQASLTSVELLIKAGASITELYRNGKDILSQALWMHPQIAYYLLNLDINVSSDAVLTAFQRLHESKNLDADLKLAKAVVKAYQGRDISTIIDRDGDSLLHMAMPYDSSLVELLIEKGIDVNVRNSVKETALFRVKRLEMAKLLVNHGAKINLANQKGELVLDRQKNAAIRSYLVTAQMREKTSRGYRYLMPYMKRNHKSLDPKQLNNEQDESLIQFYLASGEKSDKRDKSGKTLLFYANTPSIINILLKHGVNIEAVDRSKESALFYYLRLGRDDLAKAIIEKGAKLTRKNSSGQNLFFALQKRNFIPKLISNGLDINHQDHQGNTPLHTVPFHVSKEFLQTFINKGAALDIKNKKGEISLFNFVRSLNNLTFLVEQGADLKTVNKNRQTLLHKAALSNRSEVVMYLLNHDLDINAQDRFKCRPLNYTKDSGVADLLKKHGGTQSKACHL